MRPHRSLTSNTSAATSQAPTSPSPSSSASSAPSSPASATSSTASSSSSAASTVNLTTKKWTDRTEFDAQRFQSALPIFRQGDIRQLTPVAAKTDDELQPLTFTEWFDYSIRSPARITKGYKKTYRDQQYIDLLHQCTTGLSIAEQMVDRSPAETQWVTNQLKSGTFRRVEQSYKVSADRTDSGPVLVSWQECADGTVGEVFVRRAPTNMDPLMLGAMRRCVPYSQVEAAIRLAHNGPVKTGHIGQDGTFTNCNRMFDGITRKFVREYVRRCSLCQSKQPKRHKEPLQPLVSKNQWERVVMDLVDFGEDRRSRGMRYMWHAQDHFSKYNFTAAIATKTAVEVGVWVEAMLRVTGPIKILQCDNGGEFMARVYELCGEWGMERPTNSAPFHPQTNGLIERSGGTIKRALDKWMQQEATEEWADGLARITYQVNCTVSRATRRTPHELVFSARPRWDSTPIAQALDTTTLLDVISEEPASLDSALESSIHPSPPSKEAASLLIDMREQSDTTSDDRTDDEYSRCTPEVLTAEPATAVSEEDRADAASYEAASLVGNPTAEPPEQPYNPESDDANYVVEELVRALKPQHHGCLTEQIGDELDSGPYRFARRGTHGGGRCLLSAWNECRECVNGEASMHPHLAKRLCDGLRARLRTWLLDQPADRQAGLRRLLWDVGNSGRENRGDAEVDGDNSEQVCWDTLVNHLAVNNRDLGWEALAALCEMEKCNVLLFVQLHQTTIYTAKTPEAIAKWAAATEAGTALAEAERMGRRTTGGRWTEAESVRTTHLLVPRHMNEGRPFRVLWHRSQIVHTMSINAAGERVNRSDGGQGHYESLVAHIPLTPQDRDRNEWVGVLVPNTELHEHLKAIGNRLMCTEYNSLARVRMEQHYNKQLSVANFKRLNCVGLRRASLRKTKVGGYTGLDCLPCIIIRIRERQPAGGSSGPQSQRSAVKSFGLLSEFGALEGWYTADQLVTISLHNFSELVALYSRFTAGQLCAESHPDYQPIKETDYRLVSAQDAFKQRDRKRKPIEVDNSRQRDVPPRTAAVAAETALVSAQLDKNTAPSFHTLSNQPAVPPTVPSQRPQIVEVLQHNRLQTRFKVLWGAPTHDWQWLDKSHLMQWEEYRAVMEAYALSKGIDLH